MTQFNRVRSVGFRKIRNLVHLSTHTGSFLASSLPHADILPSTVSFKPEPTRPQVGPFQRCTWRLFSEYNADSRGVGRQFCTMAPFQRFHSDLPLHHDTYFSEYSRQQGSQPTCYLEGRPLQDALSEDRWVKSECYSRATAVY